MSKYRRTTESCIYKGLIDGSLLRSARRHIEDKNVHQIIVKNNNFNSDPIIDAAPRTKSSDAFLIGIVNYLPGESSIHTNHAVSAILTNGFLYCFNAHGSLSQPMEWLVNFLNARGFQVSGGTQYSGPNLQDLDTQGACTQFAYRFLKLNPRRNIDFNSYVVQELTRYSLNELYKYLNTVSSVRNTGVRSNSNNSGNNMNINRSNNSMNINRRILKAKRQPTFKSFMNNRRRHEENGRTVNSLKNLKQKYGTNYNKFMKIRNAINRATNNKNNVFGNVTRNNLISKGLTRNEAEIAIKHLTI